MGNSNNGIQWKNIIILIVLILTFFFGFRAFKYFRDNGLKKDKVEAEKVAETSKKQMTKFQQKYEALQKNADQVVLKHEQELKALTDSIAQLNLNIVEMKKLAGASKEITELDEKTNYWYVSFETQENFGYAVLKLSQESWDVVEANNIIEKQYNVSKFWYTVILPTSEYAYNKFVADSK